MQPYANHETKPIHAQHGYLRVNAAPPRAVQYNSGKYTALWIVDTAKAVDYLSFLTGRTSIQ